MPEQGPTTNFDHRFWQNLGFFGKAGSISTGEYYDFHGKILVVVKWTGANTGLALRTRESSVLSRAAIKEHRDLFGDQTDQKDQQ
jgi:hypothetical protein